jgi:hypothetical protein
VELAGNSNQNLEVLSYDFHNYFDGYHDMKKFNMIIDLRNNKLIEQNSRLHYLVGA